MVASAGRHARNVRSSSVWRLLGMENILSNHSKEVREALYILYVIAIYQIVKTVIFGAC